MLDKQRREFIILAGAAGLLVGGEGEAAREGQQPGMPVCRLSAGTPRPAGV